MATRTSILVWSDYVCPFCYLALPVLNRAAEELSVDVSWRAFELRPEPQPPLDPEGDYLLNIWETAVYPMAEERGMVLRLPPVQPRSRLAAMTAAFARSAGAFDAVHEALFRAFFEEGLDIGDRSVLLDIATLAGLDSAELHKALDEPALEARIRAEEEQAMRLGIGGVPAIVIRHGVGEAYLLSGAQPFDVVQHAIEQARAGV
ncbi:MAG: DsbA family oxidoreductase [Janthinobacterium lividum]